MTQKNRTGAALFCAALGNAIFGFSFMFSRIALQYTEPFVMLMYRFVLTALLLTLLALWSARQNGRRELGWMRFDLKGKNIAPMLAMGLIQPVGYFLCESYGIRLTNSTFSGVMIALVPIAAIVCGAIALHEVPKWTQIAFSLLSIAGVVLMTVQQRSEGQIHPLGVILLLGAVITGSYFNVLSRKISRKFSALERTAVMMYVAALTFTMLAIIQSRANLSALIEPIRHPEFLAAIAYLSICSSIIAFLALNYANNYLPVAKSCSFANLTTVFSLFAGVIFLKEPFNGMSLLASAMIIVGIWGSQKA